MEFKMKFHYKGKRKDLGFFLQLKLSLSKLLKAIFP